MGRNKRAKKAVRLMGTGNLTFSVQIAVAGWS
jgi:hypothetical protein